jgi:molecular chaperone GrpE
MKKKLLTPQAVPEAIPALATEDAQQENVSQALQKAQGDLAAANEKHLRLYSEFENFRRRVIKEKIYLMEAAGEGILKKLLPIADDFERALAALQSTDTAFRATKEGISLIYEKFIHLLQQEGVQPMPLEKGTVFDAEFHEAVTQIPVEDEDMKGKVIEVLEKGYLLKEKVLRFAKVVTGA